ncbi:hypothetical protein [Lewinella sp. JB7]|uniref:hypothetical protein n=1 Tax=Lewinella sp. JB7 TaxID=2962887 RepID=UPI0020C94781|nr:hypothetical protein [Lewinella sp. JB7]MCP9235734.1 hypothetical protein [Lewinella sp. JB7]
MTTFDRPLTWEQRAVLQRVHEHYDRGARRRPLSPDVLCKIAVFLAVVAGYGIWTSGTMTFWSVAGSVAAMLVGGVAMMNFVDNQADRAMADYFRRILASETVRLHRYPCIDHQFVYGYESERVLQLFAVGERRTMVYHYGESVTGLSCPEHVVITIQVENPLTVTSHTFLLEGYRPLPSPLRTVAFFDEDCPLANVDNGTIVELSIEEFLREVA